MVRRVKAGELCGTIAGLPWHQGTRREGKRRRGTAGGFKRKLERGGGLVLGAVAGRGFCGAERRVLGGVISRAS